MRVVYWFAVAVCAVALVLFALSNRESVSLGLWPLPFLVQVPLYLVVLATALVGFVFGGTAAWVSGRHRRRELRERRRRVAALERELAATQARLAPPSSDIAAAAGRS